MSAEETGMDHAAGRGSARPRRGGSLTPATTRGGAGRQSGVQPARTKFRKDDLAFGKAMRDLIRAYGRRGAAADPFVAAQIASLHQAVDDAVAYAVAGLREPADGGEGYSWAEIAEAFGIGKSAAHERWGKNP